MTALDVLHGIQAALAAAIATALAILAAPALRPRPSSLSEDSSMIVSTILAGDRFHALKVLSEPSRAKRAGGGTSPVVKVLCDCGNRKLCLYNITSGKTKLVAAE